MAFKYNGNAVTQVKYNGKPVTKLIYNGSEINLIGRNRFKYNTTNIKQSELQYKCNAGQASVNLYTGRMLFEHNDISIGANSFLISVNHIYSSGWSDKNYAFGKGWKLNVTQRCFKYTYNEEYNALGFQDGDYVYIDSQGYIHRFVWYKKSNAKYKDYYYDANGSLLKLEVTYIGDCEINDPNGNRLIFNDIGNVRKIISGINQEIAKVFIYDEKERLSEIYDERKPERKLIFTYNTLGLLDKITCSESDEVKKAINYYYDNNINLTHITKTVGEQTKDHARFVYYDNLLVCAVDAETKSALKFEYIYESGNYQTTKVSKGIAKITENEITIPQSKIKQETTFDYSGDTSTIVKNEKNIEIIYFFNTKGYTTSAFEKKGSDYKTLTKVSGWKLTGGCISSYPRINGDPAYGTINNIFDITNEASATLRNDLKTDKYYCHEKYTLSFWVLIEDIEDNTSIDCKAKFSIETRSTRDLPHELEFCSFLDSKAKGSWQYVTIPINFELRENNKVSYGYGDAFLSYDVTGFKRNISKLQLSFEGFADNSRIYIGDLRVAVSNQGNNIVAGKNFDAIEKIKYETEIGTNVVSINSEFFVTEKDLIQTYRSMYQRKTNECFDLSLCDGTKFIEVQNVQFKPKHDSTFYFLSVDQEGIPNYSYQSKDKTEYGDWFITKKQIRFQNDYMEQKVAVGGIERYSHDANEQTSSKNYIWTRYDGRPHAQKDAYNVITQNIYDGYGNLEQIEIYNENHATAERIIHRYEYDTTDHKYREYVSSSIENGVKYRQTYKSPFMQLSSSGFLGFLKINTYDHFGEKIDNIKSRVALQYPTRNDFSYYDNGQLLSVSDQEGRNIQFKYNEFGDIGSYGTNENGEYREIINKQYNYNDAGDSNKTKIIEKYRLDNGINQRQTILSKYGALETVSENGKTIKYHYQNVEESQSVARIQSVVDPYDNQTYTYRYDEENMLCGYETTGSTETGDKRLKVNQIGASKTEYTIQDSIDHNRIRTSTIVYENEKVKSGNKVYLQPRIYKTVDLDNGFDGDTAKQEFEFLYEYDILGRQKTKKRSGSLEHVQTIDYETIDNVSLNRIGKLTYDMSHIRTYIFHSSSQYVLTGSEETKYKFSYAVQYDARGNISAINEHIIGNTIIKEYKTTSTEFKNVIHNTEYDYDGLDRIKKEKYALLNLDREFKYSGGRLNTIINHGVVEREYEYYDNGQLKTKTDGVGVTTYTYDNYGNINKIVLGNSTTHLVWERNNLLSSYGSYQYRYNHQGVRYKKVANGIIKYYYVEGNRILGEDWSSGIKPRYFYDANGIAGIRVNSINYNFLIDVTGSVRKIFRGGKLVCEYNYDAFGKCEVKTYDDNGVNDSNHIGHINPFRWKSYYYDVETSLYYINGRYYDSELGQFINADDACINPLAVNGLNSYSLESMFGISNHLQAPINYANINTSLALVVSGDDPSSRVGGWKWWNDLHWGWKVAIGGVLFAGAVATAAVLTIASGGTLAPVFIGMGIGALVGGGVSAGMQYALKGYIDIEKLLIDTAAGAILGAFGGSTVGLLGTTIAGGAVGIGSSIYGDLVAGNDVNWAAAALSGVLGAGLGFIGGPGAQFGKTGARSATQGTLAKIAGKNGRGYGGLRAIYGNRLINVTSVLNRKAISSITSSLGQDVGMDVIEFLLMEYILKAL